MSNALNNAGKLFPVINLLEARFGAVPGAVNNTAAIQAAINAAQAVGGTLEIPEGTWRASALTITDNLRITGTEPFNCILQQIAGSNTNFVTIDGAVVTNPIIENITIDGNRNGNSSGHGLYLPNSALSYGFSVVLRNVNIQNVADTCLYVGVNRNMGHAENTEFKRGNRCVYITGSSDWRFMHGRFAFPKSTYAFELESGADNVFVACSFYGCKASEGSGTTPCVLLDQDATSPTKLIGCTINDNDREGLWIRGPSGTARHIGHQIIGCWFAENSLLTNNGYANIKCTDVSGVIFVGNDFRWTGSGNIPSYLVEFTGVTTTVEWTGNQYFTNAYVTGVSNTLTNLGTLTQTLVAQNSAFLGGASGSQSFYAPPGVSGGNYIQVNGRAAGTGPDVSAQGVDTNIALRLYSKGTGSIEVVPGGSLRAARFNPVASSVNYHDFYPSATGQPLQLLANGADTNIDIRFVPKGTGRVRFGTHTGTADTAVSGYIEIVDGGGTVRKLAVIT